MNVLVSGVAGDIGFGIARILREWGIFSRLFGIDTHTDHPGLFILDECSIAPRANERNYISWLFDYVYKNRIDVFIPSSEAEIGVLALKGINEIAGAKIIRNGNFTIQNSLDKFNCLSYLRSCGVSVPANGLVGCTLPVDYPAIVKPRSGQGSKGIALVRSAMELKNYTHGYVWQEYLAPDDQEYTCPVYASPKTDIRILVIKRKLMGGLTGSGVVINSPEIESYVRTIAETMQLSGAINIQLRLTKNGPFLFEINPRLSSTLVFRDKIGFTDLRWWVADKLGIASHEYCAPKVGTRFYRGVHEYIYNL